ncbi:chromosome segregation protein Spc25-domain-containing protein [Lentinula raphanica]|nr:chromosome segregation protein Spc25-domain-containing protein [Lentinula raphanica]
MAFVPRGFHLDLKSVLSDPNSHINLDIPVYEETLQNFLKAVNSYKNRSITAITDKWTKDAAEKKKMQDKCQKIEGEISKCKVQEIELMATLEKEQDERKDAELAITSLNERSATIQAQIDEYRVLIASLRTDKGKERSTLNSHASRVTLELHAYEKLLACTIEGMEKEQLLISFKRVDISNPERELSFVLDVSGPNYRVVKTSPPLLSLPLLVDRLNATQDIFAFIVQIRPEFYKSANGEEVMDES